MYLVQVAFENYQKLRVQLEVYGILPKEVYIPHPKVPNFFFQRRKFESLIIRGHFFTPCPTI